MICAIMNGARAVWTEPTTFSASPNGNSVGTEETRLSAQNSLTLLPSLLARYTRHLVLMVATMLTVLSGTATAQCPPRWEGFGNPFLDLYPQINAIAPLADGSFVIAGRFTHAGQTSINRIARLDPATGLWSPLGTGIGPVNQASSLPDKVMGVVVLPNGDIVAAGAFEEASGVPAHNIARYSFSTGTWSPLGSGLQITNLQNIDDTLSMLVLLDGDLLISGGLFLNSGSTTTTGFVRYRPSTNEWLPVQGPSASGMVLLPDGNVIAVFPISSDFPNTNDSQFSANVARLNPQDNVWSPLPGIPGSGRYARLWAIAQLAGGDLVVAGEGLGTDATMNGMARFSFTSGVWTSLPSNIFYGGILGSISTIAALPDGSFLVGGFFNQVEDVAASNIAKYDQTLSTFVDLGGLSGPVNTILVHGDDQIFVGGGFSYLGNVTPAAGIAMFSIRSPGPIITAQPIDTEACRATPASLTVVPGPGLPVTYQWRRNGIAVSATANPTATTGTLQFARLRAADSGEYDCVLTTVCGSVVSEPVILNARNCACLVADIAGAGTDGRESDGTVDGNDFICFINSFSVGDPGVDSLADIAGGGATGAEPDGTIDGTDFITFINAFAVGC